MSGFKDVAELANEYFQYQSGYSEPHTRTDRNAGSITYNCRKTGTKTTIFYCFEDGTTIIFTDQQNTTAEQDFSDILKKAGINAYVETSEREWGLFTTERAGYKTPHPDKTYSGNLTKGTIKLERHLTPVPN